MIVLEELATLPGELVTVLEGLVMVLEAVKPRAQALEHEKTGKGEVASLLLTSFQSQTILPKVNSSLDKIFFLCLPLLTVC